MMEKGRELLFYVVDEIFWIKNWWGRHIKLIWSTAILWMNEVARKLIFLQPSEWKSSQHNVCYRITKHIITNVHELQGKLSLRDEFMLTFDIKCFFYLPYQKIHNIFLQSQQLLHPKPRIYWSVSNPFSFSQAIILIIWDFSLVCIMNSLPFVGFGFLDNFTMIIGLYAKIIPLQM